MCKIKYVTVSQIFNEDGKQIGMKYIDSCMKITNFETIDQAFDIFSNEINKVVTDTQSIILCRDDAKQFAKSVSKITKENVTVFKNLKDFLYNNYEVKRIILNPRTLEYYPMNKAFIINKDKI